MNRNSIIYIVSLGHSGSTLLDMLIGQHPEIFSCGEIVHLPNQHYRNTQLHSANQHDMTLCSCGKSFPDCSFWSQCFRELEKKNFFDSKKPLGFKMNFIFKNSIPHKTFLERFFRKIFFLSINYKRGVIKKLFERYYKKSMKNNVRLYNNIIKLSKKTHIVDSSKDVVRMYFLQKAFPKKLKVILLYRDINELISSNPSKQKKIEASTKAWISFYQKAIKILDLEDIPFVPISYDDLIDHPQKTLTKIFDFIPTTNIKIKEEINTKHYHLVGGNKIMYQGQLKISKPQKRTKLHVEEKQKIKSLYDNTTESFKSIIKLEL